MISTPQQKLAALRADLKAFFKERDEEVDGLLVALLSRQHVILIGPPGTAKSMIARAACSAIDGGRFVYHLLDKFTTPRELLVGDVIIAEGAPQDGTRLIRFINREGPLLNALVAVLDEVFKAGGPTLNSLLLLLNEREYCINLGEVKRAPLCTVVAASNEAPGKERDDLAAFVDRFLLRFEVTYLSPSHGESATFVEMLKQGEWQPNALLSLDELALLQATADAVPVPEELLWALNAIRATLALQHGIQPSDRRYKIATKVLRAYAYLNGRPVVERADLAFLLPVLWTSRERSERDVIRRVIFEAAQDRDLLWACKLYQEAEELHRGTMELLKQWTALLPLDGDAAARRTELLGKAETNGGRLAEIARDLDHLCEGRAAPRSTGTTIATLRNTVNVFRKNLVKMRGVEEPFMGV